MPATVAALVLLAASVVAAQAPPAARKFATPEEAVAALVAATKAGDLDAVLALFGPEGKAIVDTSDVATARRNQEVFLAAAAEGWRLADAGAGRKELDLGNEDWPFPVPIVHGGDGWFFDAAAGREELLNRRIGRNELAAIDALRTYVVAQREYARAGHDGRPAGLYARRFASTPGTQDGLYWPTARGRRPSPLGELIARAAQEGYRRVGGSEPVPFRGYYFRILEGQGKHAKGGASAYVVDGAMSGGFALVAWPVHYDASGVMTFQVGPEGVVYEKDLGPATKGAAEAVRRFDPDGTWKPVSAGGEERP